jgi:hypothetical protein
MTASFNALLLSLYDETKTPEEVDDYTGSQTFKDSVRHIISLPAFRKKPQKVSEDDVKDVVQFILRLVNVSIDFHGILTIKPSVDYLIQNALRRVPDSSKSDRDHVIDISEALFKYFHREQTIKRHDPRIKYNKPPYINKSPLMRYHIDARNKCVEEKAERFYEAYAYTLHKSIRFIETQKINDLTKDKYKRAARYFFKYCPIDIKKNAKLPDTISDAYIMAVIINYNKETEQKELPLSNESRAYRSALRRLRDEEYLISRPHLGHFLDEEQEAVDGDPILDSEDYRFAEIRRNRQNKAGSDEEDAPDIDTDNIIVNAKNIVSSKKITMTRKRRDYINLKSFYFPWDAKYLNNFSYALLYHAMELWWGVSSKYNAIIRFLYFAVHTGIEPRKLVNLEVPYQQESKSKNIKLRALYGFYYIEHPTVTKVKRPVKHPSCQKRSDKILVPIPDIIVDLFQLPLNAGPVFSYYNLSSKEIEPISLLHVKSFLRSRVNRSKYHTHYRMRMTLGKIPLSFLPTYHGRGGLDTIICTHVSGVDYHRLFTSQTHYIHVPHTMLENQYLKSFDTIDTDIKLTLSVCRNNDKIDMITHQKKGILWKKADDKKGCPSRFCSTFPGYGSSIIPDVDYITGLLDKLRRAIEKSKNIITRHNLYMCYLLLGLQFAAGLRPKNEHRLEWMHFSEFAKKTVLTINDKDSAHSHEERTLPLPKILVEMLNEFHAGFNSLKKLVAIKRYPSILSKDEKRIFFFINNLGRFEIFNSRIMQELLNAHGIVYDLPTNMPRSYVRNYLYHNKMHNDAADAWLGHQHAGRELFNMTSSTVPAAWASTVLPVVEQMLIDIGYTKIRYIK